LGFPTGWSFTTHKDCCWGTKKNNLLHQLAISYFSGAVAGENSYINYIFPRQLGTIKQHQCTRLSFLDTYSRYNQIKLKKEDKEKIAFIMPYGIFCYQVMPFGLKNTGATYQRMMQNCLGSQIGRNIQVYIDDIVITTRKEESLISDLKETFDNLDRYKLKLNPTKCSFGVLVGQLLGFLVSARGIEANSEKI
jgi:hypothetical protein